MSIASLSFFWLKAYNHDLTLLLALLSPHQDYPDILGIKVCDYQCLKPDLVVFQLGDGSLLAATKEVLEASMRGHSYAWAGHKSINPTLKDLQILQDLPEPQLEADGIPVYSFG